jgi:hypothetical protein
MKKNEDAAARKKPKTSAAQLRVQKGECCLLAVLRLDELVGLTGMERYY